MAETPYMPLWVNDFLSSPSVRAMSLEEVGAYMLLLMTQWQEGSVPRKASRRAKVLGVSLAKERRLWELLGPLFPPDGNGELKNARCEDERQRAFDLLEKRRRNASKAARGRWGDAPRTQDAMRDAMRDACVTHAGRNASAMPAQVQVQVQVQDQVQGLHSEGSTSQESNTARAREDTRPGDASECRRRRLAAPAARSSRSGDEHDAEAGHAGERDTGAHSASRAKRIRTPTDRALEQLEQEGEL